MLVVDVVFAEILPASNREMGAVIRPSRPGEASLNSQRINTLVTIDP
jgi:hypothetical protein